MDQLIRQILDEIDYSSNPYFVALDDGTFEKDDFVETQIQFYFAVVFFSRPMAAVAAKIPRAAQRVEVLRNVWEEHGEGANDLAHGETFLTLLERLGGLTHDHIQLCSLWPEVRIFNTTLTGACVIDEYLVGVGVLGMIERMFAGISGRLGRGIVDRGWLSAEQMIHYDIHEELDIRHADDFFDVIRPVWEQDSDDRYYIEQGLRLGACSFNTLYEQMWQVRKRRWRLPHPLRHVRT